MCGSTRAVCFKLESLGGGLPILGLVRMFSGRKKKGRQYMYEYGLVTVRYGLFIPGLLNVSVLLCQLTRFSILIRRALDNDPIRGFW